MSNPCTQLLLARCCCIFMLLLSLAFTTSNATTTTTTTTTATTKPLTPVIRPPGSLLSSSSSSHTSSNSTDISSSLSSSSSSSPSSSYLPPSITATNTRTKRVPEEAPYLTAEDCVSSHPWLPPAHHQRPRLVSGHRGRTWCEYDIHITIPDNRHFIQINVTTFPTPADMRDFSARKEIQLQEITTKTTNATTSTGPYHPSSNNNNNNNNNTRRGNNNNKPVTSQDNSLQQQQHHHHHHHRQQQQHGPSASKFLLLNSTARKNATSNTDRLGLLHLEDRNEAVSAQNTKDGELTSRRETGAEKKTTNHSSSSSSSNDDYSTLAAQDVDTRSQSKPSSPNTQGHPDTCANKLIVEDTASSRGTDPSSKPLVACLTAADHQDNDQAWVLHYHPSTRLLVTLVWDPRTVAYFALDYSTLSTDAVACVSQCTSETPPLCLSQRQLCDGHVDCQDGSDEDRENCMLLTRPPPPHHHSQAAAGASDDKSHMVIIGVSVGVCFVVLMLVPVVLMIHFKCRSNLRQPQDSLLQQQQRPHSLSSEMYQSPSGSVQDSGIPHYDQRASLLQDQQQQHHQQQPERASLLHHASHRQPSPPPSGHEAANTTAIHFSSLPERSPLNTQSPPPSDFITQPSPRDNRRYERELRHQSYPHHIAISRDGEEGYWAAQRALRSNSQSLIQQQVFRPPPNKTISDRASPPPPYSRNPPGTKSLDSILPSVQKENFPLRTGQSCETSTKSKGHASPPAAQVVRCHSMSCQHRPESIPYHYTASSRVTSGGPPPDYHQVAAAFPPNVPVVAVSGQPPASCRSSACCGVAVVPQIHDIYSHTAERSRSAGASTPATPGHTLGTTRSPRHSQTTNPPGHSGQAISSPVPANVTCHTPSHTSHAPCKTHRHDACHLTSDMSYTPSMSSNILHTPPHPTNTSHRPPTSTTSHHHTPGQVAYTPHNPNHSVPTTIPTQSPFNTGTQNPLPHPPFGAYSVPSASDSHMFVCTKSSPSICPGPNNHLVSFPTQSTAESGGHGDQTTGILPSYQDDVYDGLLQHSEPLATWPCTSSSSSLSSSSSSITPLLSCSSFSPSMCVTSASSKSVHQAPMRQPLLTCSNTTSCSRMSADANDIMPTMGCTPGAAQDSVVTSLCLSTTTGPTLSSSSSPLSSSSSSLPPSTSGRMETCRDNVIYSPCNNNSEHCNTASTSNIMTTNNVLYDNKYHRLPTVCCATCSDLHDDILTAHGVTTPNQALPVVAYPTTTNTNTPPKHHPLHHHHHHHHHHYHQQPYQAQHHHPHPHHLPHNRTASCPGQECAEDMYRMSLDTIPSPIQPVSSLSSSPSLSPSPSSPSRMDNCKGKNYDQLKTEDNGNVFPGGKPTAKSLDTNGNAAPVAAAVRGNNLHHGSVGLVLNSLPEDRGEAGSTRPCHVNDINNSNSSDNFCGDNNTCTRTTPCLRGVLPATQSAGASLHKAHPSMDQAANEH